MLSRYKLPFSFDAAALKSDLEQILPADWKPHFNRGYYQGEWKALALRSTSGRINQLFTPPDDTREAIDTEALIRCPYFQQVLATFKCRTRTARLMSLGPGSKILEHQDYFIGPEDGLIRCHIPITTDERVEFFLGGQEIFMAEGEAWYLDFGLPHSVNNTSDKDRVHMVIDCHMNDWLERLIPFGSDEHGIAEMKS